FIYCLLPTCLLLADYSTANSFTDSFRCFTYTLPFAAYCVFTVVYGCISFVVSNKKLNIK
ncbi:MAG TPA: hypothetical protein VH396_02380, partial [Chitinophagaceae bacterium]